MLNELEKNKDIYFFEYNKVFTDKRVPININEKINNLNIEINIIRDISIGGYLWNKIFKADIIKNNNICFDQKICYCEDLLFVSTFVKHIRDYGIIKDTLYNYRMRNASTSNNYFNAKSICILDAYNKILELKFDYESQLYIKFYYFLNYYKLKQFITTKKIYVNEREILKKIKISKKQRIEFYFLKYFIYFYILYKIYNSKNRKNFFL